MSILEKIENLEHTTEKENAAYVYICADALNERAKDVILAMKSIMLGGIYDNATNKKFKDDIEDFRDNLNSAVVAIYSPFVKDYYEEIKRIRQDFLAAYDIFSETRIKVYGPGDEATQAVHAYMFLDSMERRIIHLLNLTMSSPQFNKIKADHIVELAGYTKEEESGVTNFWNTGQNSERDQELSR